MFKIFCLIWNFLNFVTFYEHGNLQLQTKNKKLETKNYKSETINKQLKTIDFKLKTRN